jgi:TP901 family phage tail tape measure protein
MTRVSLALTSDTSGVKQAADEFVDAQQRIVDAAEKTDRALTDAEATLEEIGETAEETAEEVEETAESFDVMEKASGRLKQVLAGLFAGISAGAAIQEIARFESGLVGVGKTADLQGPQLGALGEEIRGLSLDLPNSTAELLEIAQAAGQLGVKGSQDILAFTDTVAKLGSATDLAGSEAATTLARILTVTGEAASEVGTLGSVLTALGNNSAATEGEIARVATQVALSTASFKVSSTEAAAYGAALASLGVRAELAGSTVGRVFRTIDEATQQGGRALAAIREITDLPNLDAASFTAAPTEAVTAFVRGLNQLNREGGAVAGTLEALGLGGEELLRTLPSLASAYGVLANSLDIANREKEVGTALDTESARAIDTLSGQYGRLVNGVKSVATQFQESTGTASEFVGFLADVSGELGNVERAGYEATPAVENVATAIKGLGGALAAVAAVGSPIVLFRLVTGTSAGPWLALAAAVGAAAAVFIDLNDDLDETSEKLLKVQNATNRVADSLAQAADLIDVGEISLRIGDPSRAVEALERGVAQLESFRDRIKNTDPNELLTVQDLRLGGLSEDAIRIAGTEFREELGDTYEATFRIIAGELERNVSQITQGATGRLVQEYVDSARAALDQFATRSGLSLQIAQTAGGVQLGVDALRQRIADGVASPDEQAFVRASDALDDYAAKLRDVDGGGFLSPNLSIRPIALRRLPEDSAAIGAELAAAFRELEEGADAGFAQLDIPAVSAGRLAELIQKTEIGPALALLADAKGQLEAAADDAGSLTTRLGDLGIGGGDSTNKAAEFFNQVQDGLERELELIGKTAQERERLQTLRSFEDGLGELGVAAEPEQLSVIAFLLDQIAEAQARVNREAEEAEKDRLFGSAVDDLEFQIELLGVAAEERRRLIELRRIEQQIQGTGLSLSAEERAQIEGRIIALEQLEELTRKSERLGDSLANASGEFVSNLIKDLDEAEDIFEAFFRRIADLLLQALAIDPIIAALKPGLTAFSQGLLGGLGVGAGGGGGGGSGFTVVPEGPTITSPINAQSLPGGDPFSDPTLLGGVTLSGAPLSAGSVAGGGPVTINFNGPTNRSEVQFATRQLASRARRFTGGRG